MGVLISAVGVAAGNRFQLDVERKAMDQQDSLDARYRDLQSYLGWTNADADCVRSIAAQLEPSFGEIVDDFYAEISRHPDASKVITGGDAQIQRLKTTLLRWVGDLFSGVYDEKYVQRRWQVGLRHAEIKLDPVYCNMAMGRIRAGLLDALSRSWRENPERLHEAVLALNKLIDLDLAIIEHAYQTEHLLRQQQIERLATLGQIAGGVAHELRNPLNVVRTSVYYLLNARDPSPEKKAEHLRRIERQVELADGVISALANFARLPVPEARPFDIADLLRDVLSATPLPESIEVTLRDLDELPPVAADRGQLRIVFGNLVRNAKEAMLPAGRLTIAGKFAGTVIEIAVTDSGPGIGSDQIGRIMEPFFTTKARGLGLGLAISRSIVDKNHGELLVASEPGRGTTFTVRLPAATALPQGGSSP
jgi:signal transduction histidine kinase